MGLTKNSVGLNAIDKGDIKRKNGFKTVALAGNPNVGKSTLFNSLTGMKQHTGNWPGKTVSNASGICTSQKYSYMLVDIPGTYSLMAHSKEEEVARNYLCFEKPDLCVVVCDATCLERNLNLVLQTLEICEKVVVCVNLMDEAKRKSITVNIKKLEGILGVPVISTVARKKKSLKKLLNILDDICDNKIKMKKYKLMYSEETERKISEIESKIHNENVNKRWIALKVLEGDKVLMGEIENNYGIKIESDENLRDEFAERIVKEAEKIAKQVVEFKSEEYNSFDKKADKILTGKVTGFLTMGLLLMFIFWLTVSGANYPSALLMRFFNFLQIYFEKLLDFIKVPLVVKDALVSGVYMTLSRIIAVMLPPMAIFFPLFTLLEDLGYLPRIAYNLDKPFKKCNACGKQALTMCMGFGCNAAGVTGCRIVDSPRERLLAILTNNFVPCNGRFPVLIAIITMFFAGGSFTSALFLTVVILLGVFVTLFVTKLLSKTLLKGEASSYVLELPPYRKPQIGQILIRSVFDRTLFVLGRAVVVAAPAGLVIWLLANVEISGVSLLSHFALFLDPFAKLMGLDGIILVSFILGFPANEIVIPIMVMAYTFQGVPIQTENLSFMKEIFVANGWNIVTAVNVLIFTLMHWPCSTTMLTIKKETGSLKWTSVAFLLPTLLGILTCMFVNGICVFCCA